MTTLALLTDDVYGILYGVGRAERPKEDTCGVLTDSGVSATMGTDALWKRDDYAEFATDGELMIFTADASGATTVRRGQRGTTAASHLADHCGAGVDAHARLDRHPVLRLDVRAQHLEAAEHFAARPHGPLGVVLMGLRVAEIDQQPVAQVLRDVAGVAFDHRRTGLLVAAHQLVPRLGPKPRNQLRRVHEITEHHRELTMLRFQRSRSGAGRGILGGRSPGFWSSGFEAGPTAAAEGMVRRVGGRAGGTRPAQRCPAAATEAGFRRILPLAGGTLHATSTSRLTHGLYTFGRAIVKQTRRGG